MRYLSAFCLTVAMYMATGSNVYAQGDSDPGMSTVGAMRNNAALLIGEEEYENQRAHIGLGHTFAKGDHSITYNIPQIEARIPFFGLVSGGYFDVKLPIQSSSGDLWDAWGVGDLTVAYTHMFLGIENWTIQTTGGVKIGMSTADLTDGKTRSLPMSYQSGLGSTDFMVGASATWKSYITVAAGYQQPISRFNENGYYGSNTINDTFYSSNDYVVSSKLHRQGDVMLRIEGHYGGKLLGVSGGVLAFQHLGNDLYTDRDGYVREVAGTDGLTVNLMGNVYLRLGRYGQYKLDLSGAVPVVERDVKADGLGRRWMLTPRLTYFFKNNSSYRIY